MTESRSIREYTEQEISLAVKEQILLAGCAALTGENQQPYTILDITDHSNQKQLAELCDHQPFIARAKTVLVFCADFVKWYDPYQESGADPRNPGIADLYMGIVDAMIAAQNTYPMKVVPIPPTDESAGFLGTFFIEMFRMVGHGIAMGKAVEQLKQIAEENTLSVHEDGVADYIRRKLPNQ